MIRAGGYDAQAVRREPRLPDTVRVAFELGQQLAVGRVPNPRSMVQTGGYNAQAVRRELRVADTVRVAFELSQQLAVGRVPNPRCMVVACGDDTLAVRRELRLPDMVRVAFELAQQVAVCYVPNPRCLVVAGGDDALAVGRERCVQNAGRVSLERGQELAACRVPHPRRAVAAGGDDALAVGRERRVIDLVRVAFELSQQLAVGRIPHLRRTIIAGGDDALAVGRERRVNDPARVVFERGQQLRERMGHSKVSLCRPCCAPAADGQVQGCRPISAYQLLGLSGQCLRLRSQLLLACEPRRGSGYQQQRTQRIRELSATFSGTARLHGRGFFGHPTAGRLLAESYFRLRAGLGVLNKLGKPGNLPFQSLALSLRDLLFRTRACLEKLSQNRRRVLVACNPLQIG